MEIANNKTIDELRELEKKWAKAIVANDAQLISEFMSDDWVMVSTEGGLTAKESFLDVIRSGDLIHSRMDFADIRMRIYENTAVIISSGTSAGNYKDESFGYYEWSTDIFKKENGQWKCVLTMLTPSNSKFIEVDH